jgi:hypothetical protein
MNTGVNASLKTYMIEGICRELLAKLQQDMGKCEM